MNAKTFTLLSATQQRLAAGLSLALTVAMLAANVGLVDHYVASASAAQASSAAVAQKAPASGIAG